MYIVAWTEADPRIEPDERIDKDFADHWAVRETLAEAKAYYEEVVKRNDCYAAVIAGVVQTTEWYNPAPPILMSYTLNYDETPGWVAALRETP